jgi:cbb3-type cytochrome oxidase subunit 3
MMARTLAHFQYTQLTCLGLVIFLSVFISVLFWVFRPESQKIYDQLKLVPLDGGNIND